MCNREEAVNSAGQGQHISDYLSVYPVGVGLCANNRPAGQVDDVQRGCDNSKDKLECSQGGADENAVEGAGVTTLLDHDCGKYLSGWDGHSTVFGAIN